MTVRRHRRTYKPSWNCAKEKQRVFSDVSGHFISKCPKCKSQYIMNFAYFRKQKGSWRLKRKYYSENYFKKLNNK